MAGSLLAERRRRGAEREVTSKSTPTDPVSEADIAAQRASRELLHRRRPGDGFLVEEGAGEEGGSSGLTWVVDPLDGTVNFLFGIPQWCVSLAVRDGAGTVAGAVYDPNRDELFTATREGRAMLSHPGGAFELGGPRRGASVSSQARAEPGELERTASPAPSGQEDLPSAMVATGLAYDASVREAQAKVLARLASRVRDIRRFGGAAP